MAQDGRPLLIGSADHLPIVRAIDENESWVALTAWGLTFAAMTLHLLGTVVLAPQVGDSGRGGAWP